MKLDEKDDEKNRFNKETPFYSQKKPLLESLIRQGCTKKIPEVLIALNLVDKFTAGRAPEKIFIAGCGDGTEALVFQKMTGADILGVDPTGRFKNIVSSKIKLLPVGIADVPDEYQAFDLVYSFHVLEHIKNVKSALKKIRDILKPGGIFFLGVPNKKRFLGYLGTQGVSFKDRIKWNLIDFKYRLEGKFDNQFGAHAGFNSDELFMILSDFFKDVKFINESYFRLKYEKQKKFIDFLIRLRFNERLFPSNYFICRA